MSGNSYIDVFTYLRAVTGLETASLVGNLGRITPAQLVGVSSLPVASNITVPLKMFDQITIFDGPNTEVCMVGADTASGGSIPLLQPTQFAHAQYTSYCSDGVLGSLADSIIEASNWIENICQQTQFQETYTAETIRMGSMRGALDNRNNLVFRPRHFPVVSDSGITIESSINDPVIYDQSQLILDGAKQVVTVPWLLPIGAGSGSSSFWSSVAPPYGRAENLYLQITYVAGYLPANLPGDIRDVAVLLTSEILGRRENPTGADVMKLGDKTLQVTTSRDTLGETLLVKAAKNKLQPYSVEAY
jgi:hypothetical protein